VRRLRITVEGKAYSVEVGDPGTSPVQVSVDGEEFAVLVEPLDEESLAPAGSEPGGAPPVATGGGGAPEVVAPMPGTILDLAVAVGDAVQPGQILCALEAMKMKSPIRATRSGTVQKVAVHEGQTVVYGDLLFVVE
jgi:biotin carboxyl carrier protein